MIGNSQKLQLVIQEGEGQAVEFKRSISKLDREMVAFANAMGGSVYLGIDDDGRITGFAADNRVISQIHDIARNCDPPLRIQIAKHPGVIEVIVREGADKPYRCQSGFYLRVGPNSQKLTRDEIVAFAVGEGKIRFDEQFNPAFDHGKDFSIEAYRDFLRLWRIAVECDPEDVLISMNVAEKQKGDILVRNAAILFFAENPQRFFPEAYVTAIRYGGLDRTSIIDRKDMRGTLISQVNETLNFFKRHTREALVVTGEPRHLAIEEYPAAAIREAVINALMHRDYFYDSSHVYLHIYEDRIEVENPGGLFKGLTVEDLGKRSVRRNRLIAELFFRTGFIEMIGSGITRMFKAMEENGNPPPEIRATNFFNITFAQRVAPADEAALSGRQRKLLHFIHSRGAVSKEECAAALGVSGDTALREITVLLGRLLIRRTGTGRATRYGRV